MAQAGRFVWYDLMTQDVEASKAFYTELIGWKTAVWDMGGAPYTMLQAGENMIGGLMKLDGAEVPNHWIGYVEVEDIEATCRLAAELGGTVCVPPTEIPKVGRFAVLTDPFGAVISPMQPLDSNAMPELPPGLGIISWNELMADDVARGFGFYSLLFGWVPAGAMEMGEHGTYFMAGRAKDKHEVGMMKTPPMPGAHAAWLYYITVDDCLQRVERAQAMGAKLLTPPMDVPGGKAAVMMDPQGTVFAMWSKTPA